MAKALAHRTGNLSAANPANATPGPKDPFAAGTQLQLQQKIRTEQEKAEKLTAQKVALAQRLQALAMKAAGRVEADLTRVRIASGELPAPQIAISEPPSELPPFTIPTTLQIPAASPATITAALPPTAARAHEPRGMPAPVAPMDILNSNLQLQNKRRSSLSFLVCATDIFFIGRRTTGGASTPIMSSPSSTNVLATAAPSTRRMRPQPSRRRPNAESDEDETDGQGEALDGSEIDPTDLALYCFCNERSYGEVRKLNLRLQQCLTSSLQDDWLR